MRWRVLLVFVGLALGALAPTPAEAVGGAGFGATFHAWARAHRASATHCPLGGCYGPLVRSNALLPEFSFVETYRHRVVGYSIALPRGTSVLEAELTVAEQLPADVDASQQVAVIYHDRYGHSCAIYDLYSKTLADEFGPKGLLGQGDSIGVELATIGPKGAPTWNPNAIDLAIVTAVYRDTSTNC